MHQLPKALLAAIIISSLAACGGSSSSSSRPSTPTTPSPQCSDGLDNDQDTLIDSADPGCSNDQDNDETDPPLDPRLSRYQMSNACWVVKAAGNGKYLVADGSNYSATATDSASAEGFYLKPTALGSYMFYNSSRQLMAAGSAPGLTNLPSASANDSAEWRILASGDTTSYPETPAYHVEPSPEQVTNWHGFVDPAIKADTFTISATTLNRNLAIDDTGNVQTVAPGSAPANEAFIFEAAANCETFPEAQSNFSGQPFKGTQPDGTVLGHADVHVHISATEFLGGAHWGKPFHKFGVEQALGNCAVDHGDDGRRDVVGGLFSMNPNGHATDGWPTFSEWPKRDNLIHEAIYWKWLERAWAGGLRVIVNDLVDNETLCELQRNVSGDLTQDCNSMNNAGRQAGTMYAMENYIDAQYGGPGKGFFQIVHTSDEARAVIEDGKIAVVLGIEISNLFDCKLKFNPLRQQRPHEEDGSGFPENSYECTVEEGKPNSIVTQMQRVHDWGVRQIISIHEFDNAFGGNGIFDGLILNLGTRENSGGIPSGDLAGLTSLFSGQPNEAQFTELVSNLPTTELATGEWWTTYNCPEEGKTAGFTGYLWGSTGGSTQSYLPQPACIPTGQDGRSGGTTPCYPADVRQCNARWMTPAGLYTYGKMMEMGFIFDWDHMEMGMKTQALELAEAQNPVYPFVSTHGTFGGTTIDQATRLIANGGILYPSNGSSKGFREDMNETVGIYANAMTKRATAGKPSLLFGFGYGTDTNGLSAQTGPRNNPANPIEYPFTLFSGAPFNTMTEFDNASVVSFEQPNSVDADGNVSRTWHEDLDGNAHYGMLSDFVKEIVLDSPNAASQVRHLFNSAEVFLQTWKRTELASAAIQANGLKDIPATAPAILRPAPPIGAYAP
ncbi:hypothetical protein HNQ57_001564 [Zhongshania antarctica]|uniref:Uncharacterized protein n=1 Tax=Zhongshania antarctica TaxID=641702 RepID=A0A840R2J1_9GAMM|nr:hypothetical protein [Zhongshania antarctica]MBB5187295.1 hypothetical protein [Zhongshania antarctica]